MKEEQTSLTYKENFTKHLSYLFECLPVFKGYFLVMFRTLNFFSMILSN